MSYLVLARKYRPQTFDEVVQQSHVTRTLTNAISSNRMAHAVLFSGPRGTGKTTIARILAKAMNCEKGPTPTPCNVCRSCVEITSGHAVDVIEIDGASNNGVDHIRDLRENVKYMPTHSGYKIYIIDEVHMLSTAAFNALLKTLEEPPSHVMFIFATTEPHKIPITILSRCQRHDFRRVGIDAVIAHMKFLCDQEKMEISDESLELIARESGGGMRDALSLLDQVMTCSEGAITHDAVLEMLGVIDRKNIFEISDAVLRGDIPEILVLLDSTYDRGHDIKVLYAELVKHFRNLLVVKMARKVERLVDVPAHEIRQMEAQVKNTTTLHLSRILDILFREEAVVKLSAQPKLALEMAFFRMFRVNPVLPIDMLIEKIDNLRKGIRKGSPGDGTEFEPDHPMRTISETNHDVREEVSRFSTGPVSPERKDTPVRPAETASIPDIPVEKPTGHVKTPEQLLAAMIRRLSKTSRSLGVILEKSGLKAIGDRKMELTVPGKAFELNRVRQNKSLLEDICSEFFGQRITISITENTEKQEETTTVQSRTEDLEKKALNHPLVNDVIELFDGKVEGVTTLGGKL